MRSLRRTASLLVALVAPWVLAQYPLGAADRTPVAFPAPVAPRNDIRMDNLVPVPMRDGVKLYADVCWCHSGSTWRNC
jgi:predicted acyl esterase